MNKIKRSACVFLFEYFPGKTKGAKEVSKLDKRVLKKETGYWTIYIN